MTEFPSHHSLPAQEEEPFEFPSPPSLDLSVIIVSFNTREILTHCLDSLYAHTEGITFEVLVVDNGSADGSPQAVDAGYPRARLIRNTVNRGFSAANNQALRESRGRYAVLLNSDTVLVENCFQPLVTFMDRHPEYAIISPQILNPDNAVCSMRLWEDTPIDAFWKILGKYDAKKELRKMGDRRVREADTVGGSCFMIRRTLLESVGLLDENYFLYNEEDDFCRRARRAGHKVCYYPEVSIKHLKGQSTHQRSIREKVILETYKSNLYFFGKHYSTAWNRVLRSVYNCIFLAGMVKTLLKKIRGLPADSPDDSLALKLKLLLLKVPNPGHRRPGPRLTGTPQERGGTGR